MAACVIGADMPDLGNLCLRSRGIEGKMVHLELSYEPSHQSLRWISRKCR